jgi:flavin-dependent dehydrogenase
MTIKLDVFVGSNVDLMRDSDVIVIGAGPAGTAAAALVHRAGFDVRIVEAQTFPRFVIGESLLPHCMDILDDAGLLPSVQARQYQVKNGALFVKDGNRCSFDFSEGVFAGWSWTWQVPRADFDQTLAKAVEAMGVPIDWRTRVVAAEFNGGATLTVRDEHGSERKLKSKFVIDASGYGRVLPRLLDLDVPSHLPPRRALFTHVKGDRRPEGPDQQRIWICVHPAGAWIWIIPFSDGLTSVGAVASPEFFEKFPGNPEESLRAILATEPATHERMRGTEFTFPPMTLEGYSISVKSLFGPHYCLVGNATEFLDPVFSSGVTLALESASRASYALIRELRGEKVDWGLDYAAYMMRGIDVFRTFVTRWYDGTLPQLFFAPRQDATVRSQICSVLAGYVWDQHNPLVRDHVRRVPMLAKLANQPSA